MEVRHLEEEAILGVDKIYVIGWSLPETNKVADRNMPAFTRRRRSIEQHADRWERRMTGK